MFRKLITLCLILWPALGHAQVTTKSLTSTTCTAPTSPGCLIAGVLNRGTMSLQITGTFVGTLQFEQTIDGTWTTWSVLPNGSASTVTSTTAPGFWTGSVTAQQVRVRFSAYTSGTATVSVVAIDARAATAVSGGSGTPGGSSGQVQYNNAGVFGGLAKWTTDGNAVASTGTGTWFYNAPTETSAGNFETVIGVASNDVPPGDTRPDHVAAIGWNPGGDATTILPNGTAVGSSSLVFESYCSYGTGCLGGGGGQSETYFNMNDGKGSAVRPLGFFQAKSQGSVLHYLSAIARADTWGFFDATQTNLIFSIGAAHGAQDASVVLNGLLVPASPTGPYGHWLYQDGQSLIHSAPSGVAVAPNSGILIGGGDGSAITRFNNVHVQLTTNCFEDTASLNRGCFGAGSATNYPSLGASGTDDIILKPLGSSTNVQMTIESKGGGSVYLNPGGTLRINGGVGVTASGSACTVTQITKGIITGATCTP